MFCCLPGPHKGIKVYILGHKGMLVPQELLCPASQPASHLVSEPEVGCRLCRERLLFYMCARGSLSMVGGCGSWQQRVLGSQQVLSQTKGVCLPDQHTGLQVGQLQNWTTSFITLQSYCWPRNIHFYSIVDGHSPNVDYLSKREDPFSWVQGHEPPRRGVSRYRAWNTPGCWSTLVYTVCTHLTGSTMAVR